MGFAPIVAWQNDFESTLVPCFLFACCVTVSAIGDHFERVKMAIHNAKFSRVCGSYYITGDEWGKKKRPKYEWSAAK